MRDSEKSLKVMSGIVSGLLVVSALIFFLFASGKPKEAEAVLEYSAPPGFDPSELAGELQRLRKDQGFLAEVAIRGKFAKTSDPELAEVAAKLGSRLSFEANWKEPVVSIRFTHPKTATAIDMANTAAAVARERLESRQLELAKEIIIQEDAESDKYKLLVILLKREADAAAGTLHEEPDWRCRIGYPPLADAKADHEQALRKLEELRAKPVISIGSIRPAKLTGGF